MIRSDYIPLLMNVPVIHDIVTYYPHIWNNMFHNEPPKFEFFDDYLTNEIVWDLPSNSLLPNKCDLFVEKLSNHVDSTFHSLPFSAQKDQNFRAKMAWQNGRIFAAALERVPVSVFNFDLNLNTMMGNSEITKLDSFVKMRQVALCFLSLLCETEAARQPSITTLS
ncbi:hypothetical protein GPJ56_003677 [Histomonas meleagridis]|uniref:uncharacterized protein n=1 Tax=Histomonas meleagridis TaxID=135588 RepID=UPI00355A665E|nr:hypothetical protein GPJ56_003677 [Histomonas meleagridis]KAH0806238.1 hypothetical protein GO595_000926 [Histomonas meleagridis]